MSKSKGTANLGSSFDSKQSRSLLVDFINACKNQMQEGRRIIDEGFYNKTPSKKSSATALQYRN